MENKNYGGLEPEFSNYENAQIVVLPVPYDAEGSVVGITKGNAPLVAAVNLAIQACLDSGEFDTYVYEANELAAGDIIEGLVD